MKSYSELAENVTIEKRRHHFHLLYKDPSLNFIGSGRSAFVFHVNQGKVLKVYFPPFSKIANKEAEIYKLLKDIDYYPSLYDAGHDYIVIDFIDGNTFYDCLTKGIIISPEKIAEVDTAIYLAQCQGLNPSDIHLKNIFLTCTGEVKLIDVARFQQTKVCSQWTDIKFAFYTFYCKRYFPKKVPGFILDLVSMLYKKGFILNFVINFLKKRGDRFVE